MPLPKLKEKILLIKYISSNLSRHENNAAASSNFCKPLLSPYLQIYCRSYFFIEASPYLFQIFIFELPFLRQLSALDFIPFLGSLRNFTCEGLFAENTSLAFNARLFEGPDLIKSIECNNRLFLRISPIFSFLTILHVFFWRVLGQVVNALEREERSSLVLLLYSLE